MKMIVHQLFVLNLIITNFYLWAAGIETEEDLIKKYNLQNIDVLKVGHNGSETSSGEKFIIFIDKRYDIICTKLDNKNILLVENA